MRRRGYKHTFSGSANLTLRFLGDIGSFSSRELVFGWSFADFEVYVPPILEKETISIAAYFIIAGLMGIVKHQAHFSFSSFDPVHTVKVKIRNEWAKLDEPKAS